MVRSTIIDIQDDGRKTDVAVKLLRDSSPTVAEELQLEVNNMHKLRHPNLIRLHGLVFANPIMMVTHEFYSFFQKHFYFSGKFSCFHDESSNRFALICVSENACKIDM